MARHFGGHLYILPGAPGTLICVTPEDQPAMFWYDQNAVSLIRLGSDSEGKREQDRTLPSGLTASGLGGIIGEDVHPR